MTNLKFENFFNATDFFINLLQQINGLIVVMNKQSKFIYSNHYTAQMFGYKREMDILGLDTFAIRCPAIECSEDFIKQDQNVIKLERTLTILDIHGYADGKTKILLTKKAPYYEHEKLAGIICHCIDLHPEALSHVSKVLIETDKKYFSKRSKMERSYTIGLSPQEEILSDRERDCIFHLLRGKTMKDIAIILSISPRTVETHMENIKLKTNCRTRAEITEYALNQGYLNYIPKNFLEKNLSKVIYE